MSGTSGVLASSKPESPHKCRTTETHVDTTDVLLRYILDHITPDLTVVYHEQLVVQS